MEGTGTFINNKSLTAAQNLCPECMACKESLLSRRKGGRRERRIFRGVIHFATELLCALNTNTN